MFVDIIFLLDEQIYFPGTHIMLWEMDRADSLTPYSLKTYSSYKVIEMQYTEM